MRFFEFKAVELVHIGIGSANIASIAEGTLFYSNDHGQKLAIDLVECARIHKCLQEIGAFPPGEDMDWGALVDAIPDFSTLELPSSAVVGLRGAIDDPPWFQFLDRNRTQFEFKDYEHIQSALLRPLASAGNWHTWDGC